MPTHNVNNEEFSRRSFLKLGFAGILGVALLFLSGCIGEEQDDDEEEADD